MGETCIGISERWAQVEQTLGSKPHRNPLGLGERIVRIRLFCAAVVAVLLLVLGQPAQIRASTSRAVASQSLPMFATEGAAQAHCPADDVVWLNTSSGIYHEKGMRWYGKTKHGAYVCRKEADAAGDRDTRNGQ